MLCQHRQFKEIWDYARVLSAGVAALPSGSGGNFWVLPVVNLFTLTNYHPIPFSPAKREP